MFDSTERRANESINKMNTITLHHTKAAKTMSFEEYILDYILNKRKMLNPI